jgi:ABC-2 type transport system ATP-binding protein
MTSPNAIEIRGLEKRFPKFALGPLDITVPRGAIYGLIGPNGAGKTTIMDLIFRMGATDAGSITVLGLDHVSDEMAVKQQVGYVSPELNFQPWGTVGKAIAFMRGFYPTWDDADCERLLKVFGLGWNDRVLTLSFGGKTKLALVMALSWKPKVLVLDEPTVGLDAIAKQLVVSELLAAVKNDDRTVFISSHGLTDVERFADHVGMIKNGKMLLEGATSDVVERYRMVDVMLGSSTPFADRPGCIVQSHTEDRWRVLVDLRHTSLERIASEGATPIAESPVTLEELFIALGRE